MGDHMSDRDKWFAVVMQRLGAGDEYIDAVVTAHRVVESMWSVPRPSLWQRLKRWVMG